MIKKRENVDEVAIMEEIFDELEQNDNKPVNYDYINWLEKYTEKKRMFTCDDHNCENDQHTRKNIYELASFYSFIKKYAEENFIKPSKYQLGSYYSVKHNNIGYHIGCEQQPFGLSLIFCQRTPILNNFIEYSDIINNKPQKNTEHIKRQLKELADLITKMTKEDVPADAISDTTQKTLKKVLSNK